MAIARAVPASVWLLRSSVFCCPARWKCTKCQPSLSPLDVGLCFNVLPVFFFFFFLFTAQGFRLSEQPAVPGSSGAPRGHRQRERRGEGLPARGRSGHIR